MDENRLPAPVDPVDDADRVAAITRLRDLVGSGLSLERFTAALEQVLAATDHAELEAAMAAMPSIVRLTPASRRLEEPLVVDAGLGRIELGAGWQLAARTKVSASTGTCRLDLTQATWDAHEVDLRLEVATGRIEVVIPEGVAVQMRSVKGKVRLDNLAPALPGGPLLKVDAAAVTGRIRICHPPPPPQPRRRRWRRRRAPKPAGGGSSP